MGAPLGTNLNTDTNQVPTTADYGNDGAGTTRLFHWFRSADGGIAALGATDDAAITNPATDGTLIAFTRGLLTQLTAILAKLTAGAASMVKLEDDAHTSGDAGVPALAVRRDTAAVGAGTDGDYATVNVDADGRLRVVTETDEDLIGGLSNARTTALAETLNVKASAGTLFGFQGYVTTDGYVQVIADADGTLAGGEQALEVIHVVDPSGDGNGGPFSFDAGRYGIAIDTGITIAFSSAGPTHTAGGSNMFVSAQYI